MPRRRKTSPIETYYELRSEIGKAIPVDLNRLQGRVTLLVIAIATAIHERCQMEIGYCLLITHSLLTHLFIYFRTSFNK